MMIDLDRRLERIEFALASVGSCRQASSPPEPAHTPYVTHKELTEILGQTERRVESQVAEQFGNQVRAIDSLRAMIVDTDMLLERVLSRLDASPCAASSADEPQEPISTFRNADSSLTAKKPVSISAGQ